MLEKGRGFSSAFLFCPFCIDLTGITLAEETDNKRVVNIRRELFSLGRRRVMSDALKEEIAKELGFYDTVQKEGWGGIRSRDAGNMVKYAIAMAEQSMQDKQ
jgi:small acid-soluble spore protein F (minor alpha/beta-type SASP)